MFGLGLRREMLDWPSGVLEADFYEVAPENWLRRDRSALHARVAAGHPLHFHGVTLNLGGTAPLNRSLLASVRELLDEFPGARYSDHLAAAGDAHLLHDLFPLPFEAAEAMRVAERIREAQDRLGRRLAVENTTYYSNTGRMREADFIAEVLERADCDLLLDLNNLDVNHKNHGGDTVEQALARLPLARVSYVHVAGHAFDPRFGLYLDTHGEPVDRALLRRAAAVAQAHGWDVLIERDHDLPPPDVLNEELACLRPPALAKPSTTTCVAAPK